MREWSGRRASDALKWIKAKGAREGLPCVICEQPIEYRLTYPDPQSCSVQHLKSRHLYPHLTWERSNWSPSHLVCNQSQGDGSKAHLDLGLTY